MSVPIALRTDFDGAGLRREAKATKNAAQGRRLLALAEIYHGGTRTDAARIGGVGLQTIRDWGLAFNREGPAGLVNGKAPGQPTTLDDDQRRALARMVESGPIPALHGVVRWRLRDLFLVGSRGVPHQPGRDHGRARAAQARRPQAVRSAAALRSERGGAGGP